jgi:hypothetical protein
MKKLLLVTFFINTALVGFCQLGFNAYLDMHYISTFNKDQTRPFAYEQPKANQFGFNHLILGLDYKDTLAKLPFDAHVSLQAGDYVDANYSSEPVMLRHIYDANINIHIHKWITLSGGIWGNSHMGAVTTKAIDNMNPTFSMGTEYLPYYLAGGTLTFSKSDKFSAMVGVFSGYQRIRDNNGSLSPGFQFIWTPNSIVRFNIGGIIGNEADRGQPSKIKMLFTPDITITPKGRTKVLIAGGYGRDGNAQWYNAAIGTQVDISKRFKWSVRGEYFNDEQSALGLNQTGVSIGNITSNFDCWIIPDKVVIRLEGRFFYATRPVYDNKQDYGHLGLFLQFKI